MAQLSKWDYKILLALAALKEETTLKRLVSYCDASTANLNNLITKRLVEAVEFEGENSTTILCYRLTEAGYAIIKALGQMKKFH